MEKEFYTAAEVAEKLGVSIATVRRWIKSGQLDSTQAGHVFRISAEQLDQFRRVNRGAGLPPSVLVDAAGNPQFLGDSGRGGVRLARTDQPGRYAIFDEQGNPTGLFAVVGK